MIVYLMIAIYHVYIVTFYADHVRLLVVSFTLLYVLSLYNLAMS